MTNPTQDAQAQLGVDSKRESSALDRLQAEIPELVALYLFGSRAKKSGNSASDFDLAVLAARPLPSARCWEIAQELAVILGRDVDLVDLRSASAVLRAQVLGGSVLLLDLAPAKRAQFEGLALTEFARLNEERREVLERIEHEGTIYGR